MKTQNAIAPVKSVRSFMEPCVNCTNGAVNTM